MAMVMPQKKINSFLDLNDNPLAGQLGEIFVVDVVEPV